MAESGWLTRSLEQNLPYDSNYPGKIRPPTLKDSFLKIIDSIENKLEQEALLLYIFQFLILQRNKFKIQLAKPTNLSINYVVKLLNNHFFFSLFFGWCFTITIIGILCYLSMLNPRTEKIRR